MQDETNVAKTEETAVPSENDAQKEYFELLTYDEKVEQIKRELLDKKNILQQTKTEFNLKILLDIWRTYHLEQIDKTQDFIEQIDRSKGLLVNDLLFINKILAIVKDDKNYDMNDLKQKLKNFHTKKIWIYNNMLQTLDTKLAKHTEDKMDLEKNLKSMAAVFKALLNEYTISNNRQAKQLLLEFQRLENSLLSIYAELEMVKFEQTKVPLLKEYINTLSNMLPEFLDELDKITQEKQFSEKVSNFSGKLNSDQNLESILSIDIAQREVYKIVATCQRLCAYRVVNGADYTVIPTMLNLENLNLNYDAITALKAKISDKPKANRDNILAMITNTYFKKPVEQLTELEHYLIENEIMTYVIKNNKNFNSGIDSKYTENVNLPLPELSSDEENKYHDLVEMSILHYNIDASINSLNDKLSRLNIETTELIKKIQLTLIDLSSLSKLVVISPDKLKMLYEQINTLSNSTYELEQSLKIHIAEIKLDGTNLLNDFEEYKIERRAESYDKIVANLDAIKTTSNRNYRTFANELSALLEQHTDFINKTYQYKEELIQLGKEGKLRAES